MRLELSREAPGLRCRLEGLAAAAATAFAVIGASIAARAVPTDGVGPLCLFKRATGFPCPGCGLVRATGLLLHGDVVAALAMNPLGTLAVALGVPAALVWALLRARGVSVHVSPTRGGARTMVWLLSAAGAANWIYLVVRGR